MPDIPPWIAINPLDTAQYYTRGLGIGNELAQTDLARERQAQSQEEHAATLAVSLQNAQRQQEEADRKAKVAGIRFAGQEAFDAEAKALEAGGSTMSADVYQSLLLKHGPKMFYDEGAAYPNFLGALQNRASKEETAALIDKRMRDIAGDKNTLAKQRLAAYIDRYKNNPENQRSPGYRAFMAALSIIERDQYGETDDKLGGVDELARRFNMSVMSGGGGVTSFAGSMPKPPQLDPIAKAIAGWEKQIKEDKAQRALGDEWDGFTKRENRIKENEEHIKHSKAAQAMPPAGQPQTPAIPEGMFDEDASQQPAPPAEVSEPVPPDKSKLVKGKLYHNNVGKKGRWDGKKMVFVQ
jgi:hypothetical protein